MARRPQVPNRALRSLVAIVLVFAQAVGAFGFPVIQTRQTVRACGCVTPCGSDSANCCCSKPAPGAKKPRCPKCLERCEVEPESPPSVTWVASFEVRKCRGGDSALGIQVDVPAVPPAAGESGRDFNRVLDRFAILDSYLDSHISPTQDPPPRRS